MNHSPDITGLLTKADAGDPQASEVLLPLVYDHLRRLAQQRFAKEAPGQTLQPTALVHEAYMRLIGDGVMWNSRRHFFAAAAIAMRRILVERARAKRGPKRGGFVAQIPLSAVLELVPFEEEDAVGWEELDAALEVLGDEDPDLASVVNLRYFAGLSVDATAAALGCSSRTVDRDWKIARAWLLDRLDANSSEESGDRSRP